MKIYRMLVLVGGVLLMVGAALPWERSYSCFTFSGRCESGYASGLALARSPGYGSSMATSAGGGILVLIALVDRGKRGKTYSKLAIAVSVLCGLLLARTAFIIATSFATDVSFSPAFGLLYVSPLGALLGFLGGLLHVPEELLQGVATWWVVIAFVVFTAVVLLAITVFGRITEKPFSGINNSLNSPSPMPTPTPGPTWTPPPPTPTVGPTPTLSPAVVALGDFGIVSQEPCGPPCFLGIRPGGTSFNLAALVLRIVGLPCEEDLQPSGKGLFCKSGDAFVSVATAGLCTANRNGLGVGAIGLRPPVKVTVAEFIAKYGPPDSLAIVSAGSNATFDYDSLHTFLFLATKPGSTYTITPDTTLDTTVYVTAAEYPTCVQGMEKAEHGLQPWRGYGTYAPNRNP